MVKKSESKEVAKAEENLPSTGLGMDDLMSDAGAGLENVTSNDLRPPFLNIIQAGSPQRKQGKPEYIEGAQEGMIFNTLTKEVIDGNTGVDVVPIYKEDRYIEIKPAEEDNKKPQFVADHGTDPRCTQDLEQPNPWSWKTPSGNIINIVPYIYFFVIKKDGTFAPAVISFKSTLAGQARELVGLSSQYRITLPNDKIVNPPFFFRSYTIKTAMKSGGGNDWFVYQITPKSDIVKFNKDGAMEDKISNGCDIYKESKIMLELFKENKVKFTQEDYQQQEDNAAPEASAADKAEF